MPLPSPAPRALQHTRTVTCRGYKRDDGLWDIEGHLTDIKTSAIPLKERNDGWVPAGEPIHDLSLRITIDLDMNIHDVASSMDLTPYRLCPDITVHYRKLIGLRIASGFTRQTRELFGGISGCTHLLELLGPIATTAFQATHKEQLARLEHMPQAKPFMLDNCHALNTRGEVVKQHWPDYFQGKPVPAKPIPSKEIS
ncbi:DUF2889 domain-containing protein [Aliamphritea hakodatensis]|uniref:DUF2889 domain-containing protein n=1 Tax=Aliamphritea hakodatensis TaxID=2895352 RepID=UPI0022FDA821|nr:DUF2889 domain-containing protein [Aliamphritea hakodatensis]